jgi:steroid 5-alpha reductase family enzyme
MFDTAIPHSVLFVLSCALAVNLFIGTATWVVSFIKHDVSIVDTMWSLMILGSGLVYAALTPALPSKTVWILVLLAIWAVRLSAHIAQRSWGEPEDHRYQAIRARNQPNFAWSSWLWVFVLQAVLAWLVSLPLLAVITPAAQTVATTAVSVTFSHVLEWLGYAVVVFGIGFEGIADWQLLRFKRDKRTVGTVLNRGLWQYSRHPNYFGECCVWWGFFLIACATGGWWTVVSPLMMTVLLLKISGVTLLEKDIVERRPAYQAYIATTPAFVPRFKRKPTLNNNNNNSNSNNNNNNNSNNNNTNDNNSSNISSRNTL